MIKTLNLKNYKNLIVRYINKETLCKDKNSKYDKIYENYICEEIRKAEEQIKNGSKSYSEEEFSKEMRRRFGIIV